jgi:sugar lactone lactonase YvrE
MQAMKQFTAEPLFELDNEELRFLPEGPRMLRQFPSATPVLGWVAIQHGADRQDGSLNLLALATRTNTSLPLPGRPGFFVETTQPGVLVVGLERRLIVVDAKTGSVQETGIEVSQDERVIINDGIAIPGGLLFGTKHLEFSQPIGAVYHFDAATRTLRTLIGSQLCSNGKFFTPEAERATLIDIDSGPKTITRYEFDAALSKILKQGLVKPPDSLPAIPDGLRPTPDGSSIVVAYYNPAEIGQGLAQEIRLSDGAVTTEWKIPGSPRVTCPEFALIDGKVRVVFTTAVEGMPDATRKIAPSAGALFWAETHFSSLPEPPPLFPVEKIF